MEEKMTSYSIYVEKRPCRILYVFNKNDITFNHVDSILDYNKRKWGGRYNFILLAEDNRISEEQWKFLKLYDPDFVRLFTQVNKKLALDFDTKITPLQVTSDDLQRGFTPLIHTDGIGISPIQSNIRRVSNSSPFSEEVYYVAFDVDECEDQNIKNFIIRNFGTTDLRDVWNIPLRKYPYLKVLKITDKKSFIDAITSFNNFKPYVFPIQLCSLGDYINDDRKKDSEANFYIFVGDSPLELVDFWNNPFYLQSWTRNSIRQLWIPSSLAEDPELTEALRQLIRGRADPYGHGQKSVIFSSRTLTNDSLTKTATDLTQGTWLSKKVKIKSNEEYPDYSEFFSFNRIKADMEHYRGTGEQEKIIIPSPNLKEGVGGGGYWVNDLYIQMPQKKVVPINIETWLQLPKNNSVVHAVIKGSPARITQNGLPSVISSQSTSFNPASQEITITLPTTDSIFASMILNIAKPYFRDDVREAYTKPYKYDIRISSAGKHIHGFLQVFGDLEIAYQIFEKRHWRNFFDLITNTSQEKESKRLEDIQKRLTKKIRTMVNDPSTLTNGRFIDWLSHEIQKTGKVYSEAITKPASFEELEKIVKDELEAYNAKNPGIKFTYKRDELLRSLHNLTNGEIVIIGYELKCPSCLNREWRGLDEVKQIITCRGCGYAYGFSPEMQLKYKLNSLVENGVRTKGVVPVVLGLGTLFRKARHYFDFLPPVNIYEKNKLITDLDICCIIDGKFIIGEVKARHELFHPDDFQRIAQLAKEIHPDKVVFCSLDENIPQRIKDEVQKVNTELKPYGITASWLKFDSWVFEPSTI